MRVVQYLICSGVNVVLANPIVRSLAFYSWVNSVSIAVSGASVSKINLPFDTGMASTGGLYRLLAKLSKASCSCSIQKNGFLPV